MTGIEKLLAKFSLNPRTARYKEIERVLEHFSYTKIQAKGSHVKFKSSRGGEDIIIPLHNNDCKEYYKDMVAKRLKKEKYEKN